MPYPKNPIGTCPACDRENVPLGKCKYLSETERVCSACNKAAWAAASSAGKLEKIKGATKKVPAPAIKAEPPVDKQPPSDDGRTYFERQPNPVPTAVETGHSTGRAVVLSITCHEFADVTRVLSATAGLSCHIGLEGVVWSRSPI